MWTEIILMLYAQDPAELSKGILSSLSKLGPWPHIIGSALLLVFSILVSYIIYQARVITKKDKDLAELNKYIRDNEKENLQVLTGISHVLENVTRIVNEVPGDIRNIRDQQGEMVSELRAEIKRDADEIRKHLDIRFSQFGEAINRLQNSLK